MPDKVRRGYFLDNNGYLMTFDSAGRVTQRGVKFVKEIKAYIFWYTQPFIEEMKNNGFIFVEVMHF